MSGPPAHGPSRLNSFPGASGHVGRERHALELGGAPRDPRNLWPQPNSVKLPDGTQIGSKQKDDLEDALHAEVCSGALQLADAQRQIAGDWIATWESAGRP